MNEIPIGILGVAPVFGVVEDDFVDSLYKVLFYDFFPINTINFPLW